MDFSQVFVWEHFTLMMQGLLVTLEVAAASIVISFVIGLVLGTLRYSKFPVLSQLAVLYIEIIRNIPLLLIIFFGYYALKDMGFNLPLTLSAILSISVFTSALIAEIVRSGLNSVDNGQIEAARAQGLSYIQTLVHIVIPQALKRMIPPMVGQFVTLIKDTSLATIISLPELMHEAQIIYSKYVTATIPILMFVSLLYFIVNYSLSLASRRLEKKLAG